MSTGPILIPPALDLGEGGGPAASLLQLDIRVVAQPLQLAHPPAFEPEAAGLVGIPGCSTRIPSRSQTASSSSALAFAGGPDGVRWAEGAHSGWLSAGPAIRYGVSSPSYMRWAIMPWAACLRLWQWSIQMPGLLATNAMS